MLFSWFIYSIITEVIAYVGIIKKYANVSIPGDFSKDILTKFATIFPGS